MKSYADREVKLITRGDDIKRLSEVISMVGFDNEILVSYLCYIKNSIIDQLEDVEFTREEYPIGHSKGYSWEEFDKLLEKLEEKKCK